MYSSFLHKKTSTLSNKSLLSLSFESDEKADPEQRVKPLEERRHNNIYRTMAANLRSDKLSSSNHNESLEAGKVCDESFRANIKDKKV